MKVAYYSTQCYTFICRRREHECCVRELCKGFSLLEIVGYLFPQQMTRSKVEQGKLGASVGTHLLTETYLEDTPGNFGMSEKPALSHIHPLGGWLHLKWVQR